MYIYIYKCMYIYICKIYFYVYIYMYIDSLRSTTFVRSARSSLSQTKNQLRKTFPILKARKNPILF